MIPRLQGFLSLTYQLPNVAPRVLGRNPLEIDRLSTDLTGYVGFRSTGAEMRGNSAFDIALWDIFGKATGQPIAQLLSGFTRREIRTYNTCAGTEYIKNSTGQTIANFGLGGDNQYDDLNGFLHHADELALSLLEEGITGMKIWPFDAAAEKTDGISISLTDLKAALEPFEKIRRAMGDKMDIMVELHSKWQLLPALQIARAFKPYNTFWHEDPIRMDSLYSLKRYAQATTAPFAAPETLGGRGAFRDLLETGVADVIILDISWCGGRSCQVDGCAVKAECCAWPLKVIPNHETCLICPPSVPAGYHSTGGLVVFPLHPEFSGYRGSYGAAGN